MESARTASRQDHCVTEWYTPHIYAVLSVAQVLLVQSSRPGNWTIPAGKVEFTSTGIETDLDAALRETREEAGAVGTVLHDLGDGFCTETSRTHVYVIGTTPSALLSSGAYDDGATRKRGWVAFDTVTDNVAKAVPRLALSQAIAALSERAEAVKRTSPETLPSPAGAGEGDVMGEEAPAPVPASGPVASTAPL
jgi:8-oxo-dGTP pyrophosphatase MutT (NUDIX family)